MLVKTNVDISIKIQPRHPPFCLNSQTRGIWNEFFNWPDVANFLVLMLRFVFTQRKRTQASAQAQGKGKILIFVLMLASTPFSRWNRELKHARIETRTLTGRENIACQDSGVSQIFIFIISNGQKILSNVNVVVWRRVKRENSSLPVAVRVSKTRLLKLPNKCSYACAWACVISENQALKGHFAVGVKFGRP